jgi:hypothetical protein
MHLIAEINVEKDFADDTQCQAQHFCCDIQWLIALDKVLPLIEHLDCSAGHQRAEGGQSLSMEGWLQKVPLGEPGFPVVGDEPSAE